MHAVRDAYDVKQTRYDVIDYKDSDIVMSQTCGFWSVTAYSRFNLSRYLSTVAVYHELHQ